MTMRAQPQPFRAPELCSTARSTTSCSLRGLVLVGKLLEQRGASPAEVEAHVREADRVRAELASLIGADGPMLAA